MTFRVLRLAIFMASFFIAGTAFAAGACPSGLPVTGNNCYFIAANGSDSNSGTSESSPWLHAPGMPNCASVCGSVTPSAGQGFILRGGDTWHFGNSSAAPYTGGEWHMDTWAGGTCNYEGTTSGCIYWGVDQNWFSGASWARPILTGDNPTSTSLVSSCAHQVGSDNNAMALYNGAYFDNFEITGFCSSRNPANTGPNQDVWVVYSGTANIFETNLYIHGWTATTAAGTSNNVIPCTLLGGSTQSTAEQFLVALVIDGSDSNAGACAWGLYPTFSHFKDSIIRYTTQGVGQGCHDVHDNIFEYISNPNLPTHGNIMECNHEASGSTPNVHYNNIMRHINSNFFSSGQVGWWFCPNTTPDYWFNNLVYDTGGYNDGDVWAMAGTSQYPGCTGTGGQYMFNNTLSGAYQLCHGSGSNVTGGQYTRVYNEHLLNSPYDGTGCIGGASDSSNVSMTWVQANTQGYMKGLAGITDTDTCANETTTPCSPTSSGNSTVNAGGNRQAYCTTLAGFSSEQAIGTEAASACKYGTTDACAYITSSHTMSCPANGPISRPSSGAWDVGAYEYSASQSQAPQPPTGLTVTVQ